MAAFKDPEVMTALQDGNFTNLFGPNIMQFIFLDACTH